MSGGCPGRHRFTGGGLLSWASIRRSLLDGRAVVTKETTYDARLEADGLRALQRAGAPVPQVHEADEHRLVMDDVGGSGDWAHLAAVLAQTHRATNDRFGWHQDNVIGPLPQRNTWEADWTTFFIDHRLRPWIPSLPDEVALRLERACDGRLAELLDHDVRPSLIHGDLWSGNVVDGEWLIDPAVCFADRELDLAFSRIFGGIPDRFHDAYREAWPLDDEWERRVPALQLYHLLVHVELFGGGYVSMVVDRLDELGC